MEGCAEDVDGLVGKASVLLAKDEDEDVEEGVRVLERAFEATGRYVLLFLWVWEGANM